MDAIQVLEWWFDHFFELLRRWPERVIQALDQWFDLNLNASSWAGVWIVAGLLAIVSAVLAGHTWYLHVRRKRAKDRTAAARWWTREGLFRAVIYGLLAGGGVAAFLANPQWARNLLFLSGAVAILSEILNLFERWYVIKLGDEQERKEREA